MLTSYDRYFILDKKSYMPQICFFCEGETFSLVTEMKSKLKYHSKRTNLRSQPRCSPASTKPTTKTKPVQPAHPPLSKPRKPNQPS
jgi:hypothetical protein